jgi:phosphopantetheine adenylyltransferase
MNKNREISYFRLCSAIKETFNNTVALKDYKYEIKNNLFQDIMSFLGKIIQKSNTQKIDLNISEKIFFSKILLNAIGICGASGSKKDDLSSFKITNIELLGSLKNRRAILLKTEDNSKINDWLYSILIQGWLNIQGEPKTPLSDLRNNIMFNKKSVCDFKRDYGVNHFELVECKRIHPKKQIDFSALIKKIRDITDYAYDQISETEKILRKRAECKTIFLDISEYNKTASSYDNNISIIGYRSIEILKIWNAVFNYINNDFTKKIPDRIMITWNNAVYYKDVPIALVYNVHPVIIKKDILIKPIEYKGWTIGLYNKTINSRHLITVSSKSRSLAWIKAMYCNASGILIKKYAKEEKRKEQ